ncbi:hypothetical protein MiAbW_01900 [Microcystis aeruginosa NIES-4325]|uniref:PEP-CTERM protein-sorting domain-containing protein n=1 Tax=Microcystis aeruginosa NIES-4325 TaxID=2569534 RepID=A0A5J4F8E7_MICAE|nr:PEP-CTERM sorting domain-containing protein [Microcystis aeruginosa]GEA27337.1 hypothetical protein MiAbW_01900 [Microcystis aeruginosa NIES-4325]
MKTSSTIKRLSLIASGVALSTCVLAVDRANAQPILLDFEGLLDNEQILNFYDGGSGGNLGISFGDGAQAFISESAGGTGNFINEPSPDTTAFFLSSSGTNFLMNVTAGVTTGFFFFFSANATNPPTPVKVYDGLNGTGNLLATINLPNNAFDGCDPGINNTFCNWDPIGVSFLGTAKSVDFSAVANQIAFDNITLGRDTPCIDAADCRQVPEPTSVIGLLAISALGAGSVLQRKLLK